MRLIDADKAIDKAEEEMFGYEADQFAAWLSWIPTVDAVEVVRCENCKRYQKNTCIRRDWAYTKPNDFCSYGERRSE